MSEERFYETDSGITELKVIIDKEKQYTFSPLTHEQNHMFLKALNEAYDKNRIVELEKKVEIKQKYIDSLFKYIRKLKSDNPDLKDEKMDGLSRL